MSEASFMDDWNTDPFTLTSPILSECEFLELLWKKGPVEKPLIGQVRVSSAPSAPQLGYEAAPLIEDDEMAFWLHCPTGDTTGTGICTHDIDIGTSAGTSISTGIYTRDTGIGTRTSTDIYTRDTGIDTSTSTDIYTCDIGIDTSTITSTNTGIYTGDAGLGASAGTGMTSVGQLPFEAVVPCSEQGGDLCVARTKRKLKERAGSQANTECAELGSSDKSSRRAHKAHKGKVHNLCEQRRREKINDKLKTLQELIPRCNKMDKASMLGEAIGYMKSLQKQVQMFSMGCNMRPLMFPGATPMGMNFGLGMNMNMGIGMPSFGPVMPCTQFNRHVQHPIMPMQQQHLMTQPMQQQQVQDMFMFPNVRNPFQFAFVLPGQVQAQPQSRNHEQMDKGKQAECSNI